MIEHNDFLKRLSRPHFNESIPTEITQWHIRTQRQPFRFILGGMPKFIRRCFSDFVVTDRAVEIPFIFNNIPVPAPDNARVLDMGCYDSRIPLMLAAVGYEVEGVDYFKEYPFHHARLTTHKMDFLDEKFDDEVFDYVTCISAIEHSGLHTYGNTIIDEDTPNQIIKHFHRVLKPGGKLILTVPYNEDGYRVVDGWEREYDDYHIESLLSLYFSTTKKVVFKYIRGSWRPNCPYPAPYAVACIIAEPNKPKAYKNLRY